MIPWKHAIRVGLVVAVPVELVNFFVFMPPLDVGIADDASWFTKLLFYQWVVFHYPAVQLTSMLDPFGKAYPTAVWMLGGYLETALLIFACVLGRYWWRKSVDRHNQEGA